MTSAIGFIIGLALFGSITYLPLYLQIVKGHSATESGLLLTPMMAGVLITSITSGNLISRTGRYRPFPIVGTAVAAVAIFLLSRLAVSTPIWLAALYMLVLGLGLGHGDAGARARGPERRPVRAARGRDLRLDALPPDRRLDRRLDLRRDLRQPARQRARRRGSPAASTSPRRPTPRSSGTSRRRSASRTSKRSPPRSTPVFLAAAGFAIAAFLLTWLLREVPLRATAPAEGIGESFASPREDRSDRELERIISSIASGRMRTEIYRRIVDESGVDLTPAEAWLLGRVATGGTFEHAHSRATPPEEIALLTATCSSAATSRSTPEATFELSGEGSRRTPRSSRRAAPTLTRIARHRPTGGRGRRPPSPPRGVAPRRHAEKRSTPAASDSRTGRRASIGELMQRRSEHANRGDRVLHGRELLGRVAAAVFAAGEHHRRLRDLRDVLGVMACAAVHPAEGDALLGRGSLQCGDDSRVR